MRIEKILNNNVVLTINEAGQEVVVMGRGIAFQKKVDDEIEVDKVEKPLSQKSKKQWSIFLYYIKILILIFLK